jgi:hypothetical protein
MMSPSAGVAVRWHESVAVGSGVRVRRAIGIDSGAGVQLIGHQTPAVAGVGVSVMCLLSDAGRYRSGCVEMASSCAVGDSASRVTLSIAWGTSVQRLAQIVVAITGALRGGPATQAVQTVWRTLSSGKHISEAQAVPSLAPLSVCQRTGTSCPCNAVRAVTSWPPSTSAENDMKAQNTFDEDEPSLASLTSWGFFGKPTKMSSRVQVSLHDLPQAIAASVCRPCTK